MQKRVGARFLMMLAPQTYFRMDKNAKKGLGGRIFDIQKTI